MSFIVVGVDGSASSQAALVAAVEQAKLMDAEVRVVNVVSMPVMSGYEFGPIDLQEMKQAGEKIVTAALDELDAAYNQNVPVTISSQVVTGHVGIEMMRVAESDGGAAMVVSGSRGYGPFRSMLLGSVTTYLAHHLSCPLLIIPGVEESDS